MSVKEIGSEVVEWINVVEDSNQWQGSVNTVTDFLVFVKVGDFFWLAKRLSASEEGLFSMELVTFKEKCYSLIIL